MLTYVIVGFVGWLIGLYNAWYTWPAPPFWVTKFKDWVLSKLTS